jgi:serine/threonine protein kinase
MAEVAAPTQPEAAPADAPTVEEVAAAFPELEIVQVIGRGGMGIVFKVRQPRIERFAALKILPPHLAAQPDFAQRFIREARALARLGPSKHRRRI